MLLGPAKIELRHITPFRMVIHDFLSRLEIETLTNRLKKKMLFETSKPLLVSPETGDKDITSPKAATFFFSNLDLVENNNTNRTEDNHKMQGTHIGISRNASYYADKGPVDMMHYISKRIESHTFLDTTKYGSAGKYRVSLHGLAAMVESHRDHYTTDSSLLNKKFESNWR